MVLDQYPQKLARENSLEAHLWLSVIDKRFAQVLLVQLDLAQITLVQLGINPSVVTTVRIRLFYRMIWQFKPRMDFRHDVLE